MSTQRLSKDAIFNAAAELPDAAQRQAFLDEACANHPELREEIEDLLERDLGAGSFLEFPSPLLGTTVGRPITDKPGNHIGRYKLLEEIGQGGFGVVYMAEQLEPVRRRVALKIIKLGMDTKQVIGRFEAERQALAMMDHPNIAKVLDAGTTETGRPFFVMELVRGNPITEFCDDAKLTTSERLALFIDVCHAVQHAHQKGVIHRDIKPSNVLVTLHDDRPVPKVIDFGIAKATQHRLTERTVFTEFKQFIGTPMYMSPEQAALSGLDVDTRTDVYSLGVLLYELLTGSTPFDRDRLQNAAYDEICRIIREEEPSLPSTKVTTLGANATTVSARRRMDPWRLRQVLRGELDWIVMKALEKDRTRRYESAGSFARDVERFLHDEPIEARPASTIYRLRKFASRNRSWLIAASLVVIALLSGAVVSTWQAIRATAAYREATQQRERAVEASETARQQQRRAETAVISTRRSQAELALEKGQLLGEQGDANLALLWMTRALKMAPEDAHDLRRAIRLNLSAWSQRIHPLAFMLPHQGRVDAAAFTAERDVLVTAATAGNEGFLLYTWDLRNGAPLRAPFRRMRGTALSMAFDPKATNLAVGYVDGRVEVMETATGTVREVSSANRLGPVTALVFNPQGDTLLIARAADALATTESLDEQSLQIEGAGLVQLVDVSSGTPLLPRPLRHEQLVWTATFSPDGSTFVTESAQWLGIQSNARAHFWDISGQEIRQPLSHASAALLVAFSPNGEKLLTGHWDLKGRMWDLSDEAVTLESEIPCSGPVGAAAFHPREPDLLLVGDNGGMARLWNLRTDRQVGPTLQHHNLTQCTAFSPDGRYAVCGTRGAAWVREIVSSHRAAQGLPGGYKPALFPLSIDHANNRILVQDSDGLSHLRNAGTGHPIGQAIEHPGQVVHGALSTAGDLAATIGMDRVTRMWNLKTGGLIDALEFPEPAFSVAISPDGKTVAVGYFGEMVVLWDAWSGKEKETLRPRSRIGPMFSVEYSRDGESLLVGGTDGIARLLDVRSGKEVRTFPQMRVTFDAAFSPDGSRIVTCGAGKGARVYDADSGAPIGVPLRHDGPIFSAAFSLDGRMVLTGGADGTARLWDITTGKQVGPAMQHEGHVERIGFWPDGRTVVTAASSMASGLGNPLGDAHYWQIPRPLAETDAQIELWVQTITGMELDEKGAVRLLDPDAWQARRHRLEKLGLPEIASR